MNPDAPARTYTPIQRAVALVYGLVTHLFFAVGVGAMMLALYTGLTIGRGPWTGGRGMLANGLLILQFPILHSFFLGPVGRRWIGRLAPMGLGRDLGTTLFALFASLQLTVVFLLWSPSGVVWYRPQSLAGWIGWAIPYAASWILLIKGMGDAGLSVQMGSLGWWAVFRGRAPVTQPFQVRGLYKYVRQPVYIAFALTLWTGAVWTPDRLALALAWTAYCILGPLFKEQRYRKHYGLAYTLYQWSVPYWVPRRPEVALTGPVNRVFRKPPAPPAPVSGTEVLIAGAGPVGLLLANLLGARGVNVLLVEKRVRPPDLSMAIGVTPPSLQVLQTLGLDAGLVQRGVRIRRAVVHGDDGCLGGLGFDGLPGGYPFILSVPQCETLQLLEESLRRFPSVRLLRGTEVAGLVSGDRDVTVRLKNGEGEPQEVRAGYVAACDGHKGPIRGFLGIAADARDYHLNFLMADFEDRSGLGDEAHLFFTASGSAEAFPLPGGLRRWVVLTDRFRDPAPDGFLEQTVKARTGFDLAGSRKFRETPFHVRRALARRFSSGRVVLCGDSAHVLSPIGGQGMNTGFADAEFLAHVFATLLRQGGDAAELLDHYEFFRRRAFAVASARAARGMWLGTRTGTGLSRIRDCLLRRGLRYAPVRDRLPPYFAMLTIPFNTLARVPALVPAAENR
jgi:2-polyprenyl-6-methoxyphenol hydroxylase-like FAD-dependent oxidoreductase/protein-S-isoprenylcysteine O-methyltransferase Ste14